LPAGRFRSGERAGLALFRSILEATMSLDKSLKKGGNLARARNVLSRAERLAVLQEDDRWSPEKGVFNLPKTKYRRLAPGQSGPKRPASSG
jgi:small basic protein (TIGR04137 family)